MGKRGLCVAVPLVLGVGVGILLVVALPAVAASLSVSDGVIERDVVRTRGSVLPENDTAVMSVAGELYVSPTGTDAGDCTAPYSACLTVQYAVDSAVGGCVIKVASGWGIGKLVRWLMLRNEYRAYRQLAKVEGVPFCYGFLDRRYLVLEYIDASSLREAKPADPDPFYDKLFGLILTLVDLFVDVNAKARGVGNRIGAV